MQPMKQERSLGELISELAGETSTLVRQEVALAKTELARKAGQVGRNVAYLAVGGAVAYAALLAFMAAAIMALSNVMPWWAAALVIGVLMAVVAGIILFAGYYGLKETDPVPRQTVESLKEDAQWVKEKMK
jgi:uncharacterized membrane protein YqjE